MFTRFCAYFDGVQHPTCLAGVEYARVKTGLPEPDTYPCALESRARCRQKRRPTFVEIEAKADAMRDWIEQVESDRSPCCDAPIDESRAADTGRGPCYCSRCDQVVYFLANGAKVPV